MDLTLCDDDDNKSNQIFLRQAHIQLICFLKTSKNCSVFDSFLLSFLVNIKIIFNENTKLITSSFSLLNFFYLWCHIRLRITFCFAESICRILGFGVLSHLISLIYVFFSFIRKTSDSFDHCIIASVKFLA